jgi:hypothetical protein
MRVSRTTLRLATESRDEILLRGKVCNTPLFAYLIKTLFKCFILGEFKTFAKHYACVLSCVISCECMCMILCVYVCACWHDFNSRISNTCALGTRVSVMILSFNY